MKVISCLILIVVVGQQSGHGLDCECGLEKVSKRIVGGNNSSRGKYPWITAILIPLSSGSFALCTGSLINDQFIITAASCFGDDSSSVDVSRIVVTINAYTKTEYESAIGNSNRILIDKLIVNPNYNALKTSNLALLRLKTRLKLDPTFSPICLASFNSNQNLFTLGFGQTNLHDSSISDILQESSIIPINYTDCNVIYQKKVNSEENLSEGTICGNGNPGILSGDFGGPLYTRINGQVYMTGISSHYFHEHDENGKKKLFDVFEKIQSHLIWIDSETNGAQWCHGKFQAISSAPPVSSAVKVDLPPEKVPPPLPPRAAKPPPRAVVQPLPPTHFGRQPHHYYPKFRPVPVPVPVPFYRYHPLIPRQPASSSLWYPTITETSSKSMTSTSSSDCECGLESSVQRIINGKPVKVNRYPWMASILTAREGTSHGMCGGSLISDGFILTAAHCVYNLEDVSRLIVTLGSHTTGDRFDRTNLKVESIHIHPEYNQVGEINDIALIELEDKLTFNETIRPICLPLFYDQDNLFVTGWGLHNNGIDPTTGVVHLQQGEVLQEVEISEVDMATCQTHYNSVDLLKDICAGGKFGGTCLGDSGGPLSTRKDGLVYQVGITSFGAVDCGIISNSPNVFERTKPHLKWIGEVTNPSNWCSGKYQAITNS